jgi:acetolactate synthase I/III small subunit
MKKHQILMMMRDRPGILSKVTGLFSKRGFNIDGITCGVSEDKEYFRMTITVIGDESFVEQVRKQAAKLIDVKQVEILDEKNVVKRELALIKVKSDSENRLEVMKIVEIYRAKIIDISHEALIIELTGDSNKVEGLIGVMDKFGILEVTRTGISAMHRGIKL